MPEQRLLKLRTFVWKPDALARDAAVYASNLGSDATRSSSLANRPVDLFSCGCCLADFPPFPRSLLAQGERGRVGRSGCSGLMDVENYELGARGGSTPLRIRPNNRWRLKADVSHSHSCLTCSRPRSKNRRAPNWCLITANGRSPG